jgi:hypothetical protein
MELQFKVLELLVILGDLFKMPSAWGDSWGTITVEVVVRRGGGYGEVRHEITYDDF